MSQRSVFDAININESLIGPAVRWLEKNGTDPRRLVNDAIEQLRRRKRALPHDRRIQYATKVLLGEFFARWAAKHRGRAVEDVFRSPKRRAAEFRPFELALIAAGDEQAFKRVAPRFVRKKMAEHGGLSIGTPDGFASFVADKTCYLAAQFLKNFDSSRPRAAQTAVGYLQKTAVSWYLIHRTKPIRKDAPNLQRYLTRSKRLGERTVLAVKLAYLPALLTPAERQVLRERYGFERGIGQRLPVKVIAQRLGFKSAAVLSRKLYRVRVWCRRSAPPPPVPAGEEVES